MRLNATAEKGEKPTHRYAARKKSVSVDKLHSGDIGALPEAAVYRNGRHALRRGDPSCLAPSISQAQHFLRSPQRSRRGRKSYPASTAQGRGSDHPDRKEPGNRRRADYGSWRNAYRRGLRKLRTRPTWKRPSRPAHSVREPSHHGEAEANTRSSPAGSASTALSDSLEPASEGVDYEFVNASSAAWCPRNSSPPCKSCLKEALGTAFSRLSMVGNKASSTTANTNPSKPRSRVQEERRAFPIKRPGQGEPTLIEPSTLRNLRSERLLGAISGRPRVPPRPQARHEPVDGEPSSSRKAPLSECSSMPPTFAA